MAGFPPRFGTGMSPMAGTQPIAPTPTLPGLQPPMGGVPPVGSPIPLNSSNSGIAGYGGSSSGRDKFSKYLQQMNTTAPLALNRGGPVRMREGGMVQQQFLPPMNLGRPHQMLPPNYGGYGGFGGNNMHLGLQGGIQGALQPLRNHISQQLQQQTNQQINPFIDGVASDARETFDLQQDQLMSVNPMQPQLAGLGLGIQQATKIPFNGNLMNRGFPDTARSVGPFAPNTAVPVPYNQGGAVPRQTMIEEQPHMLAYIDPQEQSMLRQMGGSGQPGPGGVPAYARTDGPGSENFGAEARDFREEREAEAEQNREDADARQAEANQRAALESMFSGQFPPADEIEVMNTAGYDKEPTQYPTANRDSYAGLSGGPLFSNTGGLEDPFSRDNRSMTNLGNSASNFLNSESAEGTFEGTKGYGTPDSNENFYGNEGNNSVFADGVMDRMSKIFGGNTVNAGTGSLIPIPQFSSANFPGDGGNLESSDVGYLGGEASTAGGSDIDPVSSRIELAKRLESLDGLALARSKFGLPPKSGAFGSADEYVNSMKERIDANRPLPDDVLFAAPQEFKNRAFPDFNFDVSDPNTVGNYMNMSSGSSGLTSGLMTGDPFAPTKDSRGYMPYNPKTDDFVRNDTPSTPLPSNDMFGTADLANQTPTSTGFGFDDDGEGFDSSVMYSDFSEAELEQLSLDGDEGASNALRARINDQNARELDAFERDRASKGFRDRPATSMAPPRDDVFSIGSSGSSGLTSEPLGGDPFPPTRDAMGYIPYIPPSDLGGGPFQEDAGINAMATMNNRPRDPNRFNFVEEGRDLNRANKPYSSLGGTLGEDMSDNIIDEIPYDASFEREPAVPTFTSASSGGSGLTSEPLSGDPFPPIRDAMGYIPPTPYDASFPREPAVSNRPTISDRGSELGFVEQGRDLNRFPQSVSTPGLIGEDMAEKLKTEAAEQDENMYGTGMFDLSDSLTNNDLLTNIETKDPLNRFEGPEQDEILRQAKILKDLGIGARPTSPLVGGSSNGKFINTGGFGFDEDGDAGLGGGPNISKDYIKSLEKKFTDIYDLGKFDSMLPNGEIEKGKTLNRIALHNGAIEKPEDFYAVDRDGEKLYLQEDYVDSQRYRDGSSPLELYTETLREFINYADIGEGTNIDFDRDEELRDSAVYNPTPADSFPDFNLDEAGGYGEEALVNDIGSDSFPDFNLDQAGGYEEEAVTDINSELGTFDLDSIAEEAFSSDNFVFPDDEVIKLEKLINDKTLDTTTKKIVDGSKDEAGDNLYYKVLDELNKGNYPEETKKELLKRLRDGIRNQGWVRDAVSFASKAHPILFLVDKLMIGLVKKDMKFQADLLDGDKRGYLKAGQTATAVRIQKGKHKGKYVGVVIMEGDKVIEYKGHAIMPHQFDRKDPLYDYILGDSFKPGPDSDDSPAPNDPCPAGYVLSGGSCVPVQNVGEDDDTTEDDTTDDDTEDETPTETLDEIIARIRQPPRVPTEPTETFKPITFANQGGAMGVDPLTSGAVTDSLASATQRFLSSLTG